MILNDRSIPMIYGHSSAYHTPNPNDLKNKSTYNSVLPQLGISLHHGKKYKSTSFLYTSEIDTYRVVSDYH